MGNWIHKWTDKLEGKWETILISLCEMIVGILLIIRPLRFTAGIIVAAGIFCILLGLKYGIKYFRMDIIRASTQRDLFKALVCIGGGVFLVFGSGWLSATQRVLNIVYGVSLLLLSAEKIQWSVNLLRWQKPYWYVTGVSAVLTVVMAILMLLNPFPKQVIWIVMGISLIVEAILDMIALCFAGKNTRVHNRAVNANISDTPREKKGKKREPGKSAEPLAPVEIYVDNKQQPVSLNDEVQTENVPEESPVESVTEHENEEKSIEENVTENTK